MLIKFKLEQCILVYFMCVKLFRNRSSSFCTVNIFVPLQRKILPKWPFPGILDLALQSKLDDRLERNFPKNYLNIIYFLCVRFMKIGTLGPMLSAVDWPLDGLFMCMYSIVVRAVYRGTDLPARFIFSIGVGFR